MWCRTTAGTAKRRLAGIRRSTNYKQCGGNHAIQEFGAEDGETKRKCDSLVPSQAGQAESLRFYNKAESIPRQQSGGENAGRRIRRSLCKPARSTPSLFISESAASVSGDAYLRTEHLYQNLRNDTLRQIFFVRYLNAIYALCGAVLGLKLSRAATNILPCASVNFLIGEPPPISAYCF